MFATIRGKKTRLQFSTTTFFKNVKVKISGSNNHIFTEGKVTLRNLKFEINGSNNQILIHDGVRFYENGKLLIEGNNCKIVIGAKTTFGSVNLFCTESDTNITIGTDCMFGREIKVLTGDFHSILDIATGKRINPSKSVFVGNHVWIGYHACLSKGSYVSDDSIVASYSLVSKNFEEKNVVLAGSPAKIVKSNVGWDRKKLPMEL